MGPIGVMFPSVDASNAQASGLGAIGKAIQRLSEDAQQIVNPNSPAVTGSLVDLSQALALAQAGAKLIRADNKMLGTLLDTFA